MLPKAVYGTITLEVNKEVLEDEGLKSVQEKIFNLGINGICLEVLDYKNETHRFSIYDGTIDDWNIEWDMEFDKDEII